MGRDGDGGKREGEVIGREEGGRQKEHGGVKS